MTAIISKEAVVKVAKAIEPKAFSSDERTRHMFASPLRVDIVQGRILEQAERAIAALIESGEVVAKGDVTELVEAADGVIERWDSPLWKDMPHTGTTISKLRVALNRFQQKKEMA